VIGAGLAGLTCAEELIRAGWSVTIVDKARGSGGRASTRRVGDLRFDHGAQVLTARDPRFEAWVAAWEAKGCLATWAGLRVRIRSGAILDRQPDCGRFVGVPGMSGPIRELARTHGVRFGVRVEELIRRPDGWQASCAGGESLGSFDQVVLATPAPQASHLLEPVAPELAARVREIEFAPCWAALVAFSERPPVEWDSAQVEGSPLVWIAHNTSKPGRPQGGASCWVLHAGGSWSEDHLERPSEWVADELLAALAELMPGPLPKIVHLDAHRWRYASPVKPLGVSYLSAPELGLSVCGDGLLGERLEAAFLSGLALGEHLVVQD
jgi:predicted NAD/FAD-dependent oxidoreductase